MSGYTRVAIVTGAGQGIGRAIALRLADDGLDVAVNDIQSNSERTHEVVSEIRKKGRKSLTAFADISCEADVRAMINKVVDTLGGVDVMVANAGIVGRSNLIVDVDMEAWDPIMNINLRGVMLSYKYAARQMIEQGRGGRIIGKRGGAFLSAYSASKFGVRGLTQCAALELAEYNITVNAYAPGAINTSMLAQNSQLEPKQADSSMSNLGNSLGYPDLTVAEPEVIAGLVSYLVRPEAYFITGQTLSIDGGIILS